ncbi:hypothetical protein GGS21DRAFT_491497 [Xylaria nigripes]|nr:hypothetical protein GGS21DRAFT_491497 [Xylaria nigripes]
MALVLASCLFITSSTAAITSQFQNFYHQHALEYEYILQHNCSQQFANYLTGRPQDFEIDVLGGGGPASVLVQPVIECLLGNISEYIKAASASAQVILGLTPPILATLGASTDEIAMISLVGRRHLLALLLSFGNPSVYIERALDFRQPQELLRHAGARCPPYRPTKPFEKFLLAVMQYAIAIAAVVNIATLSWQLGVGTVCSWWPNTVFAQLTWSALSIPIHLAGLLALRLRLHRKSNRGDAGERNGFGPWLRSLLHWLTKSEWQPAVCSDKKFDTEPCDEGKFSVVWSWFLSVGTVIHIIFGSLVLSSLLFIGPQDALIVVVRYVVSVLACRAIVAFELAGMRQPQPQERGLESGKAKGPSFNNQDCTQENAGHRNKL